MHQKPKADTGYKNIDNDDDVVELIKLIKRLKYN